MFRDEILSLAVSAISRHPNDIDAAHHELFEKIKSHPDFQKEIDKIAMSYAKDAIWKQRKRINRGLLASTKRGDSPAKVIVFDSKAVRQVCKTIYDKYVDGRRLGDIYGRELPELIRNQRLQSIGHANNATLFAKLVKHVPENKTVEESISSKRLTEIYRAALARKKVAAVAR